MDQIDTIIERATAGLDFTDDQKKVLKGLYLISFYKTNLEVLIGLKGNDPAFLTELNSSFANMISSLDSSQKSKFDKIIQEQNDENLAHILVTLKNNLPLESQDKMDQNLSKSTL